MAVVEGAIDEAVDIFETSSNISVEFADPSNISTDASLFISGRSGWVSSSMGSGASSRVLGTGVRFGGSSDFSRLAGDWERATADDDDDNDGSVGWRRVVDESGVIEPEASGRNPEVGSVSISAIG